MPEVSAEAFLKDYTKALDEGSAALFVGAGLSVPAGFVNWKELLRSVAQDLGLDIDKESDMIALAQYHQNEEGSRQKLNTIILDAFTERATQTDNHKLITQLPVDTIWTTNYDELLEDAYKDQKKIPSVKHKTSLLTVTRSRADVSIYKMHGDISDPTEAVITKDDFETYDARRGQFLTLLQGDLLSHTFLFLGYGFGDPNIEQVLSRVRIAMDNNKRSHFWIQRRHPEATGTDEEQAKARYEARLAELRVKDLWRYGIKTVYVDEYSQITDLLTELVKRSRRKNIFVAGSAVEFGTLGDDRLKKLAERIGRTIIHNGYNLHSGFGLGLGGPTVAGALEKIYAKDPHRVGERVKIRAFPQDIPGGMTRDELYTKYRHDFLSDVGFCVFLAGNRTSDAGVIETAPGVLQEFEICKVLGRYPIPVGMTGYAAESIYAEVERDLDKFFPKGGVAKPFGVLGQAAATDDEIIDAIFEIIGTVAPD